VTRPGDPLASTPRARHADRRRRSPVGAGDHPYGYPRHGDASGGFRPMRLSISAPTIAGCSVGASEPGDSFPGDRTPFSRIIRLGEGHPRRPGRNQRPKPSCARSTRLGICRDKNEETAAVQRAARLICEPKACRAAIQWAKNSANAYAAEVGSKLE